MVIGLRTKSSHPAEMKAIWWPSEPVKMGKEELTLSIKLAGGGGDKGKVYSWDTTSVASILSEGP